VIPEIRIEPFIEPFKVGLIKFFVKREYCLKPVELSILLKLAGESAIASIKFS